VGGNAIYDKAPAGAVNVKALVVTPRKGRQEHKMATAIHPTRCEEMSILWQSLWGAEPGTLGMLATCPLSALSEQNEVHVVYDKPATMGTNAVGGTHCEDCSACLELKKVNSASRTALVWRLRVCDGPYPEKFPPARRTTATGPRPAGTGETAGLCPPRWSGRRRPYRGPHVVPEAYGRTSKKASAWIEGSSSTELHLRS
jgi:hypothetical protein